MWSHPYSRRSYLAMMGAGASMASAVAASDPAQEADRARRMKWWREAKFGMFVHFGLYSLVGRHEWVMHMEGIPVSEYETLAGRFSPRPNAARAWAKLARRAGMKYIVLTTKHCEGFCLFDSKYTKYCAPKQACGRDLVKEYVEAARAEGLRVGFYYVLFDWHHPDGDRCTSDEAARKRYVEYLHGQIRELCTNYGKIDIFWYDAAYPLDAKGLESERMNKMVFELQPDIIVNNRNALPGDFSTPEGGIVPEKEGRAWETCMTMNDSWGYQKSDDEWKTPKAIIRNLVTCARLGGNYLLNIGPRGDGSIPEESVRILNTVGEWMDHNGPTVYGAERCKVTFPFYAVCTRTGNMLFVHTHFWPGETLSIPGLRTKVKSARFFATGEKIAFQQDRYRVRFTGLPASPPDHPVTVLAVECESEPVQDMSLIRKEQPRGGA